MPIAKPFTILAGLCFYVLTGVASAVQPVAPPPARTIPLTGNIEELCPRPAPGLYKGACDARLSTSAEGSRVAFDRWVGCRMQYEASVASTAALYANDIHAGWERDAERYLGRLKVLISEQNWRLAEQSYKASVAMRPKQAEMLRRQYEGKEADEARLMAAMDYATVLRTDTLELGCMVEIAEGNRRG
jgi:hypothetical protein